jgi:hypothetical protein
MAGDVLEEDVGQLMHDDSITARPGFANWGRRDVSIEELLLSWRKRRTLHLLITTSRGRTVTRKSARQCKGESQNDGHCEKGSASHGAYLGELILSRVRQEVNFKSASEGYQRLISVTLMHNDERAHKQLGWTSERRDSCFTPVIPLGREWKTKGLYVYSKCQKFFPNYPENPLFEKAGFPDLSGKNFYHMQRLH